MTATVRTRFPFHVKHMPSEPYFTVKLQEVISKFVRLVLKIDDDELHLKVRRHPPLRR